MDLRDFWAPGGGPGRLSLRRLGVLLQGLPHNAAVNRALAGSLEAMERDRLAARRAHYARERARQLEVTARD